MNIEPHIYGPIAIVAGIVAGLLIALEIGLRFGKSAVARRQAPGGAQVGAIQGATLGMLGLLLAFSFAGASGRFMERQDLIVREANAIGTAHLRADLLAEPHRSAVKQCLVEYTGHRVAASRSLRRGISARLIEETDDFHRRLWEAASAGANASPHAVNVVIPPVNDVIDLHATRVAAGQKHLPGLVLGLLAMCSALALGVIGYGCGLSGRRHLALTGALPMLVGAALWTTIDLDYPRIGLIQVSDAPLQDLLRTMKPE